jgi:glyoxylase-like metal-dependent hydrolase (beta-lactamase superfamily II)
MRLILGLALAMLASTAGAAPLAPHHLITGGVYEDKGPDGNTIILDAPDGLIVVDTGRHPDHAEKILAYAKSVGKPVAAVVNSHWHLDHTTGNMDLRKAYPGAPIVASRAIEGQLFRDFIAPGRAQAKKELAEGTAPEARRPGMIRAQAFLDEPEYGRPTRPVTASGPQRIAGRTIDVRLAPFAVSEGDVWLVVPEEKLAIVGDLVVDIVPFMDTACVEGWSRALGEVAAVDFETLIPGHGSPMTKPQFLAWKSAFDRLVDCGQSDAAIASCVEGWMANAAPFIAEDKKSYSREAAAYYVETRLRSKPEEQQKFCAVPKG